ncbi:hypothetical protein H0H81_006008 [Sphagnurus paluster]|uniref:BZIP domain-containing protein n=1 Tax=Sphagnurus paluster TaxID=117069 RepID=A0A9P7KJ14_9AGAR|nr:hypothetical protein H0H81_006008 [Sphagnurus paluster]
MVAPTNTSASVTNPVSSSSTLWATASKEWVIAPKPKPGRKPKKDISISTRPDGETQLDNKGRRVQNRAAQRAFRERKQSQLAELQARIQSYEQGEVERNVALQNIAKRLKEENENLRAENALLKDKLLKAAQSPENNKKRWMDDAPSLNPSMKRAKMSPGSPHTVPTGLTAYAPSPPSIVSSPGSTIVSDTPSSHLSYETHADMGHTSMSSLLAFSTTKPSQMDVFPPFDCGFCSDDTPCVCREFVAQQVEAVEGDSKSSNTFNRANENSAPHHAADRIVPEPISAPVEPCILENLPPYQPPVPLRRRKTPSNINSVFMVTPHAPKALPENCSGDPSNCMACTDDAFGKAFCSAIEESVAAQVPCVDCPCRKNELDTRDGPGSACCGNSSNCCRPSTPASTPLYTPSEPHPAEETMPTNVAWRQIKSHPNVSFADLSLLAEVVARRSKCTGPRVVISPALGSITPERASSAGRSSEHEGILLTDPQLYTIRDEDKTHGHALHSPRLVPQEVLIRCGRQRVREVETESVRAALRLLDAKFT